MPEALYGEIFVLKTKHRWMIISIKSAHGNGNFNQSAHGNGAKPSSSAFAEPD